MTESNMDSPEEEIPHPLRDYDVHLLGEFHLLDGGLQHLDDAVQTVRLDERAGVLGHVRRLHRVHLLGAALRGPDGEDARASAHVKHHLVLELARVEANGVVVGGHARLILEHVLLVIEVAVGAEVVGEVGVSDLVGLHDDHVGVGGFGAGHGGGRAGRLAGSAAENGARRRVPKKRGAVEGALRGGVGGRERRARQSARRNRGRACGRSPPPKKRRGADYAAKPRRARAVVAGSRGRVWGAPMHEALRHTREKSG